MTSIPNTHAMIQGWIDTCERLNREFPKFQINGFKTEQQKRCERGACYAKDLVNGHCKFCGAKATPCTHPTSMTCSTCEKD